LQKLSAFQMRRTSSFSGTGTICSVTAAPKFAPVPILPDSSEIGERISACVLTSTVVAGREAIRTGAVAALVWLSGGKLAEAITMEISPPLAERLCEELPWADVACGAPAGEKSGSDEGGFELLPEEEEEEEEEENPGEPFVEVGAATHLGHLPLPEWVPGPPTEHEPATLLPAAVRRAGEVGGPITITICLAGLVVKAGYDSGRGGHQKKRRATPDGRRAAQTRIGV
jgi:hypothetical protein